MIEFTYFDPQSTAPLNKAGSVNEFRDALASSPRELGDVVRLEVAALTCGDGARNTGSWLAAVETKLGSPSTVEILPCLLISI